MPFNATKICAYKQQSRRNFSLRDCCIMLYLVELYVYFFVVNTTVYGLFSNSNSISTPNPIQPFNDFIL